RRASVPRFSFSRVKARLSSRWTALACSSWFCSGQSCLSRLPAAHSMAVASLVSSAAAHASAEGACVVGWSRGGSRREAGGLPVPLVRHQRLDRLQVALGVERFQLGGRNLSALDLFGRAAALAQGQREGLVDPWFDDDPLFERRFQELGHVVVLVMLGQEV